MDLNKLKVGEKKIVESMREITVEDELKSTISSAEDVENMTIETVLSVKDALKRFEKIESGLDRLLKKGRRSIGKSEKEMQRAIKEVEDESDKFEEGLREAIEDLSDELEGILL